MEMRANLKVKMNMNDNKYLGSKVFGNWIVKELIGCGSFGSVYKIERTEYKHTYTAAMKVISIPSSSSDIQDVRSTCKDEESVRAYFNNQVVELVNEITLMDKLKGNSNIVSYEDHLVVERKDEIGWDIFIRMELLTPMSTYLEKHEFTVADVIILGVSICKALEFCRNNHIIHRDIKPQNIFISEHGYFKLGDFGISKQLEKDILVQSKKGTFVYMAPEVYSGKAYDESVDIYSLGLVLYRLLNDNRTPFLPYHPAAINYVDKENSLTSRMSGLPIPPPRIAIEPITKIIFKACAFKREDRYESPSQMRAELEKIDLEQYRNFKLSVGGTDVGEVSSSGLYGGNSSFVIHNSLPETSGLFQDFSKDSAENAPDNVDVSGVRKPVKQEEEESRNYSKLFDSADKLASSNDKVAEAAENTAIKAKTGMGDRIKKLSILKKILSIIGIIIFLMFLLVMCLDDPVPKDSDAKTPVEQKNGEVSKASTQKKNGTFKETYDNGHYEGQFVDGQRQGAGTYVYTNGDKYTGEWSKGNKNGKGRMDFAGGGYYEGSYKDGKYHGYGELKYSNGNVYQGNFDNSLREDKNGKLTFATGVVHVGGFTKDQITGYGERIYTDGTYKGEWVNGKREGYGRFAFTSGPKTGEYYEGNYKNDLQHGTGKYYYPSTGKLTTGIWENGKYTSK